MLAILAVGAAALAANTVRGGSSSKALVVPVLYSDASLAPVHPLLARAKTRADRLAAVWLRSHPARDDRAFSQFVLAHLRKPPGRAVQRRELSQLRAIASTRSPAGDAAAPWLEKNGKKAIWKLYASQYAQLVAPGRGDAGKARAKGARKLAGALAASASVRFHRLAPYEVDATLADSRASVDQTAALRALRATGAKRFSYPSKHAARAAAAAAVLDRLEPHRASEFDWMLAQVVYSRMYAGGHFPSDVEAGAEIGYLVADYELRAAPPAA